MKEEQIKILIIDDDKDYAALTRHYIKKIKDKAYTVDWANTFEKAMEKLEEIVQELESGDLPLEKAMQRFEEGIKLSKFCSDKLDETEKKISLLTRKMDGTVSQTPFPADGETDDDV